MPYLLPGQGVLRFDVPKLSASDSGHIQLAPGHNRYGGGPRSAAVVFLMLWDLVLMPIVVASGVYYNEVSLSVVAEYGLLRPPAFAASQLGVTIIFWVLVIAVVLGLGVAGYCVYVTVRCATMYLSWDETGSDHSDDSSDRGHEKPTTSAWTWGPAIVYCLFLMLAPLALSTLLSVIPCRAADDRNEQLVVAVFGGSSMACSSTNHKAHSIVALMTSLCILFPSYRMAVMLLRSLEPWSERPRQHQPVVNPTFLAWTCFSRTVKIVVSLNFAAGLPKIPLLLTVLILDLVTFAFSAVQQLSNVDSLERLSSVVSASLLATSTAAVLLSLFEGQFSSNGDQDNRIIVMVWWAVYGLSLCLSLVRYARNFGSLRCIESAHRSAYIDSEEGNVVFSDEIRAEI